MKLVIDVETRSKVDLKACGADVYSMDAELLCFGIKVDNAPAQVLMKLKTPHEQKSDEADYIYDLLRGADEIHAHNARFERLILKNVLGFDIPLEKWRCTAAQAAALGLPRALGEVCKVLKLRNQKDPAGMSLIHKLCKPMGKGRKTPGLWDEDPAALESLYRYCAKDVEAEYELSNALPPLSASELEVWRLDQKINDRGIYCDLWSARRLIEELEWEGELLTKRLRVLADDPTITGTNVNRIKALLCGMGLELEDMTKKTVASAKEDASGAAKEILGLRQMLGKASTAKFQAMLNWACPDKRIRGSLMYHGTDTGRWAGRGPQFQNLPSRDLPERDVIQDHLWAITNLGGSVVDDVYGWASKCARSVLTAAPGNLLAVADYANIEGRLGAWLAAEEWKVQAFRDYDKGTGPDLYKLSYSKAFNVPVESVTKDQRQIGKVMELALQYGGGIQAFATMALGYGIDLESLVDKVVPLASDREKEKGAKMVDLFLERGGAAMSKSAALACDILKQKWRAAHPEIVRNWYGLEDAAIKCVESGSAYSFGKVTFGMRDRWLCMVLPSGRVLSFLNPRVITNQFGRESVAYEGEGKNHTWGVQYTYGGKWFNCAVQGGARCILAHGMMRCELAELPVVLSVHDEVICEVDPDMSDPRMLSHLLCLLPSWAEGLPIAAEAWSGERYGK
jgi:DNA polymerase